LTVQWVLANVKFTIGIIFMMARTYEHGIHLFFINFQKGFKLQNLQIAKDEYQKVERLSSKICRTSAFFITIPVIIINVNALYEQEVTLRSILASNFYGIGVYITIIVFYSQTMLGLLKNMYRCHRFEFYGHYKRMILLYVATMISTFFVFVAFVYGTYGSVCLSANSDFFKHQTSHDFLAFYDSDDPETSICSYLLPAVMESNSAYPT